MEVNKGIVVSGGQFHGVNVAVGDGAQAGAGSVVSPGADQQAVEAVRRQLADLVDRIRAAQAELPDADQLVETAQQADGELARERTNKHTVLGLLAGLAEGVGRVAGLAEAVSRIRQAVAALF